VQYQLVTFKFADNAYRVKMLPSNQNVPSFGRAKEVAVGSTFEFAILHRGPVITPRWIRMGLWRSKALVEIVGETELKQLKERQLEASLPINPLDTPGVIRVCDMISMPPSSLADHVQMETEWLKAEIGNGLLIPANMKFTFPV
jgi:CRISPR-associated protein Csc1